MKIAIPGPAMAPNPHDLKLLSVIIPAQDEGACIISTVRHLHSELNGQQVPHEILVLNRLGNFFVKQLFHLKLNDTTNAFKAYRRTVIDGCRPLISPHFNLTVELPVKAIVRGYSWLVIPITWRNRSTGITKLKIKEMGSRYLFICLYLWLEKYFSRGAYRKKP